jgi:hypothetical protein
MDFEKLSSTNACVGLFGLTNDQLHGFFSQLLSFQTYHTGDVFTNSCEKFADFFQFPQHQGAFASFGTETFTCDSRKKRIVVLHNTWKLHKAFQFDLGFIFLYHRRSNMTLVLIEDELQYLTPGIANSLNFYIFGNQINPTDLYFTIKTLFSSLHSFLEFLREEVTPPDDILVFEISNHSLYSIELTRSSYPSSPLPFKNYSHWKKWMIFFIKGK